MKAPEREARRWWLQAENDVGFVEWLRKEEVFFDKGCFMAQQAGEKALKACLYATGARHVLGHSLFEMAGTLSDMDVLFRDVRDPAKRLDRFYIPARYPNGLPGGSPFQVYAREDLDEAWADLETIVTASQGFLQSRGVL